MNLTISINNKEEALLALNIINTYIDNYSPNQQNNEIVDEKEKLFIELFSKLEYDESEFVWCNTNDEWVIEQNNKFKTIYFSYYNFWLDFEEKFNLNNDKIRDFLLDMIEKHLNLKGYTVNLWPM